jgi:hypothetical protein
VNETVGKYLSELNDQLRFTEIEFQEPIKRSETAIHIILNSLQKLKLFTTKYKFKNKAEEITFFKHQKPQFFSKIIFYTKVLNIETKRPKGSDKAQRKHFLNELNNLQRFFDNNLDFYQYYRTGATYLDDKYFVRGKHDVRLSLDTFFFAADPQFNTSHDFKVAEILANDLLEIYLKEQLSALDNKETIHHKHQVAPKVKLSWTDSKVALIELLYAFYYQGSFNNGKADLKEIAAYFEVMFNIDLGDVYRTWYSIKSRKVESTAYLETLKALLQKKIDEPDSK